MVPKLLPKVPTCSQTFRPPPDQDFLAMIGVDERIGRVLLATTLSAHEPATLHDHGSTTLAAHHRRAAVTFGLSVSARHRPWSAALIAVGRGSSGPVGGASAASALWPVGGPGQGRLVGMGGTCPPGHGRSTRVDRSSPLAIQLANLQGGSAGRRRYRLTLVHQVAPRAVTAHTTGSRFGRSAGPPQCTARLARPTASSGPSLRTVPSTSAPCVRERCRAGAHAIPRREHPLRPQELRRQCPHCRGARRGRTLAAPHVS
jgi:hypothetical protein